MEISYNKTAWEDAPSSKTPITAQRLNNMEQGIEDSVDALKTINSIVVESGTSGTWTWRKWSDGTAECWGEINFPTVALDSLWDTFHYTSLTASLPSGLLIEKPNYCNVASAWDSIMFAVPQSKVNTSDTVKFAAVRLGTKAETFQNVPFAIHAIGRWK